MRPLVCKLHVTLQRPWAASQASCSWGVAESLPFASLVLIYIILVNLISFSGPTDLKQQYKGAITGAVRGTQREEGRERENQEDKTGQENDWRGWRIQGTWKSGDSCNRAALRSPWWNSDAVTVVNASLSLSRASQDPDLMPWPWG